MEENVGTLDVGTTLVVVGVYALCHDNAMHTHIRIHTFRYASVAYIIISFAFLIIMCAVPRAVGIHDTAVVSHVWPRSYSTTMSPGSRILGIDGSNCSPARRFQASYLQCSFCSCQNSVYACR